MPSLMIQSDGETEKYSVEAATVTLGRGLESDVRLKDIKASRRHCQIVKLATGYKIVDLASGNGTYVNGVQINEQELKNGDKIQIGSTIINFDLAGTSSTVAQKPATTATRPTTASKPAPAAGGPAPVSKPPTAKVADASAPTMVTSKVGTTPAHSTRTSAGPAPSPAVVVKPATQSGTGPISRTSTNRIATQPTGKITTRTGGTQRMATASTSRTKKSTGRATTVSKTARFKMEAGKPKKNPLMIIIGGAIGLLVAVVVVVMMIPSGDTEKNRIEDYNEIMTKARGKENSGDYSGARELGEEALKLLVAGDKEKLKIQMAETRKFIDTQDENLARAGVAQKKFNEFKEVFKNDELRNQKALSWPDMRNWGNRLREEFGSQPWEAEWKDVMERIENCIKTGKSIEEKLDFQNKRNDIIARHKVDKKEEGQWGAAIQEWREYLKSDANSSDKTKAEGEINFCNTRANEELNKLKPRVENKSVSADDLRARKPAFAGTDCEAQFDELITQAGS